MLILTRRVGEAVHIGNNITLRVLGVKGGQVRIGFDVPKEVNIIRTELLNKPKKKTDIRDVQCTRTMNKTP